MSSAQNTVPPSDTESRGSTAPLLPGSFPQSITSPHDSPPNNTSAGDDASRPSDNAAKRFFLKLGKKTDDDKSKTKWKGQSLASSSSPPAGRSKEALQPASSSQSPERSRGSVSSQRGLPYGSPVSPVQGVHSSSPRMHSPASSQIFERNVQEEVVPPQASPQIPSHIITENHIPPALDASSAAITDEQLDPDSVEIVTHAMHQSAVLPPATTSPEPSTTSLPDEGSHHRAEVAVDDSGSNYAALDSAEIRRLSFISFADVVHAEHAEQSEPGSGADLHGRPSSTHLASLANSVPGLASLPRSPSPVRSPLSSPGHGTSPPSSVAPSFKGMEASSVKVHRGSGSSAHPPAQSPPLSGGGELNVETMTQALRKTASGDLGVMHNHQLSATGNDDGTSGDDLSKEQMTG